jgi:hypothetical protein
VRGLLAGVGLDGLVVGGQGLLSRLDWGDGDGTEGRMKNAECRRK